MDAISETRLKDIHPVLADRIRQLEHQLEAENIMIRVTCGLRSWMQQLTLRLRGRDAQGNIVDPAQVVTHAQPGYGLGVDVAPFDDALPDWNASHPAWKRIVALGESLGLTSGAEFRTFPDWPAFPTDGEIPVYAG